MISEEMDWENLNDELSSLDWDIIFTGKAIEDIGDNMIYYIEEAVKKTMRLHDNSKPSGLSSNNIIPRNVRILLKKKCKITRDGRISQ